MKKRGQVNHKKQGILVTRPLDDGICFIKKMRDIAQEKRNQEKESDGKGELADPLERKKDPLWGRFRFQDPFYIQPLLAVNPITPEPFTYQGESLIFTSRHGVRFFAKNFKNYVVDKTWHKKVRNVWCVGEKTAALAKNAGFSNVIEGGGSALSLLQKIQESQKHIDLHASPNAEQVDSSFIHISGEDTTMDFEKILTPCCKRIVLYRTVAVLNLRQTVIRALNRGSIGTILLYSKKTAQTLLKLYPYLDKNIHIVGLSEAITSLFPRNPSSIYQNESAIVMALREKMIGSHHDF